MPAGARGRRRDLGDLPGTGGGSFSLRAGRRAARRRRGDGATSHARGSSALQLARPLGFGLAHVGVLQPVQSGREEDRSRGAQASYAGAGRQEAHGGEQAAV